MLLHYSSQTSLIDLLRYEPLDVQDDRIEDLIQLSPGRIGQYLGLADTVAL